MNEGAPATLEQLHAFYAVATCEHVTRAAAMLGLSQPALSHKLKTLSNALRLDLFERVGRGVRLTADGRALLPIVAAALDAHSAVEETAASRRGLLTGNLALAASNTVGIYRAPSWLAGFLDHCPDVQVRIRLVNTIEAIRLLREGDVDCSLVAAPGPTEGLEELAIETDELVVVAAPHHPLVQFKHRLDEVEFAKHRYLAREADAGTEKLAAQLLGSAYRTGAILEIGQVDAIRIATLAGLGYAVLPSTAIRDDLSTGRLCQLILRRPALQRTLGALRRPSSHGPALEALWHHLTSISIEGPIWWKPFNEEIDEMLEQHHHQPG